MFESERGQAEWCESVARSLCERTAVEECPGNVKQILKSTTIFEASELEIALHLHVDDGYVMGLVANMM